MERYHTIVKIERLRKELRLGAFEKAYQTVQGINTKKVNSLSDLSLAAEAYVHAGRYEKARKLYQHIYVKTRSKRILSKLVHISIKMQNIELAEQYLTQYDQMAPEDFYRHIFRYNLYKLKGKGLQERIAILLELKGKESIDYWIYELARLYHKAGEKEKCLKECEDLILWFGEGEYVEKAKALKLYYEKGVHPSGGTAKDVQIVLGLRNALDAGGQRGKQNHPQKERPVPDAPAKETAEKDNWEEAFYLEIRAREQEEAGSPGVQVKEEDTLIAGISRNLGDAVDALEKSIQIPAFILHKKQASEEKRMVPVSGMAEHPDGEEAAAVDADAVKRGAGGEDGMAESRTEEEAQSGGDDTIFPYPQHPQKEFSSGGKLDSWMQDKDMNLSDIFGEFYAVPSLQDRIFEAMERIAQGIGQPAGIVITDDMDDGFGRRLLAKRMAKAVLKLGFVKSNKAAVFSADKINQIYFPQKKNQLMNGCVIIEDAAKLSYESLLGVRELYRDCQGKIVCIMEGAKGSLQKKLKKDTELNSLFAMRVHMQSFSIEEWKIYLYALFQAADYELTVQAEAMLQKKLEEMQGNGGSLFASVTAFAKACIKNSETRSGGLLRGMREDMRLDSTMLMVIRGLDLG